MDQVKKVHGQSNELYAIQFAHDKWFLTPLTRAMERNHQELQDFLESSGSRVDGNGKSH